MFYLPCIRSVKLSIYVVIPVIKSFTWQTNTFSSSNDDIWQIKHNRLSNIKYKLNQSNHITHSMKHSYMNIKQFCDFTICIQSAWR